MQAESGGRRRSRRRRREEHVKAKRDTRGISRAESSVLSIDLYSTAGSIDSILGVSVPTSEGTELLF